MTTVLPQACRWRRSFKQGPHSHLRTLQSLHSSSVRISPATSVRKRREAEREQSGRRLAMSNFCPDCGSRHAVTGASLDSRCHRLDAPVCRVRVRGSRRRCCPGAGKGCHQRPAATTLPATRRNISVDPYSRAMLPEDDWPGIGLRCVWISFASTCFVHMLCCLHSVYRNPIYPELASRPCIGPRVQRTSTTSYISPRSQRSQS